MRRMRTPRLPSVRVSSTIRQDAQCGGVASLRRVITSFRRRRAWSASASGIGNISGQIQLLEAALGSALFAKSGRGLALTEAGRLTLGYAEKIFSVGAELEEAVRKHPRRARMLEFRVGVADAVPKSIAYRLVEPATQLAEPVRIVCREWKLGSLLAELAQHRLDLAISDAPIPPSISVRAFSHHLGASGVSFFAAPALLESCAGRFPHCLDGAPLLMPGEDSAVGQRLRSWFQTHALHPRVVGEFDDSALANELTPGTLRPRRRATIGRSVATIVANALRARTTCRGSFDPHLPAVRSTGRMPSMSTER